jgi:hypothetical protein
MGTCASTRSSTELASVLACALPLALVACGEEGGYRVRVAHDDPALSGALACVEVSLVGSCAEQTGGGAEAVGVRQTVGGPTDRPIAGLGRVPAGAAGVYVRACDGCRVVAAGCRDVVLEDGGEGDIAVTLAAVDGPACGGVCAAGACRDATVDVSRDAAVVPGDDCRAEGERCTSGGAVGTCLAGRDGEELGCCTGCQDGDRCVEVTTQSAAACGRGGATCVECRRAGASCEQDVCFDGACAVDYEPGTCGGEASGSDGMCGTERDVVECGRCAEGVPCGSMDPGGGDGDGTCRGPPGRRVCCTTCWDGTRCLGLDELGDEPCTGGADCAMCRG